MRDITIFGADVNGDYACVGRTNNSYAVNFLPMIELLHTGAVCIKTRNSEFNVAKELPNVHFQAVLDAIQGDLPLLKTDLNIGVNSIDTNMIGSSVELKITAESYGISYGDYLKIMHKYTPEELEEYFGCEEYSTVVSLGFVPESTRTFKKITDDAVNDYCIKNHIDEHGHEKLVEFIRNHNYVEYHYGFEEDIPLLYVLRTGSFTGVNGLNPVSFDPNPVAFDEELMEGGIYLKDTFGRVFFFATPKLPYWYIEATFENCLNSGTTFGAYEDLEWVVLGKPSFFPENSGINAFVFHVR